MFRSRSLFSNLWLKAVAGNRRKAVAPRPRRTRPQLEHLEDRITPSVTVTTTLDPATPTAGQISLREAINMVNAGQVADNTIILPNGNYQLPQGALVLTHSLSLQGGGAAGTSINGGGNDRVLLIDPSTTVNVQLSGATITGGNTSGDGGGIDLFATSAQPSSLTLTNCVVTGNASSKNGGGGISAQDANLTLIATQVSNNTASQFGGGIELAGGHSTSNLTLQDSSVSDNQGGSAGGGVSVLGGGNGSVTITGSTISNNSLTGNTAGGGGLYLDTIGAVAISNTTLSNNVSLLDGGGIDNSGDAPSSFALTSDTFDGNQAKGGNGGAIAISTASNVTIQNSILSDNTASVSGGGIFDSGNGNLTLDSSTVSGNQAQGGLGGGIDYTGSGAIALANCTVSSNIANGNGANNVAGGGGLEVNNTSATATITDSLFSGNIAKTGEGGGVDEFKGLTLTVTGSTFTANQAAGTNAGGALNIETSGSNAAGTASRLVDDTITGNTSGNKAGGVEVNGTVGSDVNFVSDTINGNFATTNGGGVRVFQGTATFLDTIVAGNSVTTAADGNDISDVSTVVSQGGNFIGDNTTATTVFPAGSPNGNGDFAGTTAKPLIPLLGPLQDNGGIFAGAPGSQQIVPTEALLPGSLALANGVVTGAPTTDERGFSRVINGHTDIGAFQFQNASLSVTVAPATPTATINGTETFTITVSNTGGNALPADNSTLSVTLSNGLTTTGPLTFALAAIPAGQSQTFTVTATATTLGTQTVTATVVGFDAKPSTVVNSATINVAANMPPPPLTHTPIGALTLFGFGFGPTGIDLFEVDGKGEVFAQAFGFGGASGSPQFVASDAVFSNLSLMHGAIVADVLGGNGQPFLTEVLSFSDPFVFQGLLNALLAGR